MRRYFFISLLLIMSSLFGLDAADQFDGYPIHLSDTSLATPVIVNYGDAMFLGMGSLDSNFYIVPVDDPESFLTVPVSGPVTGKTVAFSYGAFVFQTTNGNLYSVNTEGSITAGFPIDLGESSLYSSPALLDDCGIVCVVDNSVYLVSDAGEYTNIADFESEYGAIADPAFGDIDGDETPDIIVAGWDQIYAFTIDGTPIDPFPVGLEGSWHFSYSPPVIADVMHDGTMDILIGGHQTADDYWGGIFMYQAGTGLVSHYPVAVSDTGSWLYSNIIPADVDGDTLAELCILSADGYVRYANPDRGSTTIWEDVFYVSEGSLESGLLMTSVNGDLEPDFVFLSADTGRIVRRQYDGYNADDSLDYLVEGDTYDRQAPIIFQMGDDWFCGAASNQGNLNLWQMEYDVPNASYKWLMAGCDHGGTFVNPEPPVYLDVTDNGTNWTVTWDAPPAHALPIASTRLYLSPADPDDPIVMLYEGTVMSRTFETDMDSQTVYITVVYSNGSESAGKPHLLVPGEGISESRPQEFCMNAYPNPFNNAVNISTQPGLITIYDIQGRQVSRHTTDGQITVSIDGPGGIYTARFVSANGNVERGMKLLYLP